MFHIGATHGHHECFKMLVNYTSDKEILKARDCCRYTVLHYCTPSRIPTHTAPSCCWRPALIRTGSALGLHFSSSRRCLRFFFETVMLLCDYGANVHAQNLFGETPLLMAVRSAIGVQERMKVQTRKREGEVIGQRL